MPSNQSICLSRRICLLSALFCLLAVTVRPANSQMVVPAAEAVSDTVITAFVPAAAYASDLGLVGGLIINRFNYHPRYTPYRTFSELRLVVSTRRLFDIRLLHEQTETLGHPVRSRWVLNAERQPRDHYFGIGNDTPFDADSWDERYYFFEIARYIAEYSGRKNFYTSRRGKLDAELILKISHVMPEQAGSHLLALDRPRGTEGGWVNQIGAGLIWENRDSEFAATRGNRLEIKGLWAPDPVGSYPMTALSGGFRQFVSLPVPHFHPVLAGRITGSWVSGKVPFWEKPYLGDEYTLRGYPLYRFRGDASLCMNLELRTWLYEYEPLDFKFGAHVFHDRGRVFTHEDTLPELFRSYHHTFGGGVATALFTPDFILRIDLGVSEEMYRLYMNVGYMF